MQVVVMTWGRTRLARIVHDTFSFAFSGFSTGFFVVLLESSKTLTNLGELAFFRTPTEVPVNERALIRRT